MLLGKSSDDGKMKVVNKLDLCGQSVAPQGDRADLTPIAWIQVHPPTAHNITWGNAVEQTLDVELR